MVVETPKTIRVAVTQHEPEWLDMPSAVDKTCRLIAEAAANKADIITFPECWIPRYPAWIWARPVDMELARQYIQNCVAYGSPEMQQICDAASQNKIAVVLGFSENDSNSVYISQCTIDDSGEIVMKRRKLKPTHMERTIFGDASGPSLLNVKKLSVGKVGALSCWEHIQPLLKYHTMCQREEIHVSAWPPLDPHPGGEALWGMSAEGCCLALSQTYAAESATFVLHTTAVITEKGIDKMQTKNGMIFNSPGGGSSAIVGPDGRVLSTAIPPTEEGFIYADLDMQLLVSCRHFVDACGHYSRPDMLWLGVDTREKAHCQSTGDSEAVVQV